MAYEALAVRDDCQIRWWGPLVKLPRCREKPTRHSPQDSTNGPFGRMYLEQPDDLDFRAYMQLVRAEFRIGTAECTKFGVFSE
jgi:hypothetical protein